MSRRASKFPRPGSIVSAWWEDENYQHRQAGVVVMSTSRHKRALSEADALRLLRDEHGPATKLDRIGIWHSITQADLEVGLHGEQGDAGDWAEDASGKAWVRVAYPAVREEQR